MSRALMRCATAATAASVVADAIQHICTDDGACDSEEAGASKTSLLQRHAQGQLQGLRALQLNLNSSSTSEEYREDDGNEPLSYEEQLEYLTRRKSLVMAEIQGCTEASYGGVGGCDAPCGRSTCRKKIQRLIHRGWEVFDAVKKVDTQCIEACYCSVTDFGQESPIPPLAPPKINIDPTQLDIEPLCGFRESLCGADDDAGGPSPSPYTGPTNQCTAADRKAMEAAGPGSKKGSFQETIATCARSSFSFTAGLLIDKFKSCMSGRIPLTDSCLNCFVFSAEFGLANCRIGPCIQAWCSAGCQACGRQNKANVDQCVGFEPPQAPDCIAPGVPAPAPVPGSTGGCTEKDFAIMTAKGPGNAEGTFPAIVAACSRKAFSFTLGIVADKFNGCMNQNVGLSGDCNRCFAETALWNINNCKIGPCIQSWCSEGCLACARPHEAALAQCAGGKTPAATPC
eukprot:TRINITY_DN3020_c0_g2_i2.p1 TRINITY_DN3020_c0_g2~~TRINITY_DN3020_c0_g2_i2.p1  ORF type:complete len:456 (+),score=101.49 TRINITY_DN3020_c0_g2_i2:85-1452(+)